jgi:hypothetical protein
MSHFCDSSLIRVNFAKKKVDVCWHNRRTMLKCCRSISTGMILNSKIDSIEWQHSEGKHSSSSYHWYDRILSSNDEMGCCSLTTYLPVRHHHYTYSLDQKSAKYRQWERLHVFVQFYKLSTQVLSDYLFLYFSLTNSNRYSTRFVVVIVVWSACVWKQCTCVINRIEWLTCCFFVSVVRYFWIECISTWDDSVTMSFAAVRTMPSCIQKSCKFARLPLDEQWDDFTIMFRCTQRT